MRFKLLIAMFAMSSSVFAQNQPSIIAVGSNYSERIVDLFCPVSPRSGSITVRSIDDKDFNEFYKFSSGLISDGICKKMEVLNNSGFIFFVLSNKFRTQNYGDRVELVDVSTNLSELQSLENQLIDETYCRNGFVSCRKKNSAPTQNPLCVSIRNSKKTDCGIPQ